MEWLIAGLGNPGEQYRRSRHNAGFMVVEELAGNLGAVWKPALKFKAEVAETKAVLMIKPQTFMNLSGEAVGNAARFYKIPPNRVVVIHDDLDLELGAVKSGLGKGPKQHNGVLSVEKILGTADFWRVRIGIEDRTTEERRLIPGQAFVLMAMSETEAASLNKAGVKAVGEIKALIKEQR
jgi:peptidyl-tRNA hydrolase, PTH1 family